MNSNASAARGLALGLMAALYLWSGALEKPLAWTATVAYAGSKGLPLPGAMVAASLLVEVLAPIALLRTRWRPAAAVVLALYTLMTALLFHDFWSADPSMAEAQLQHFMKNIALAGAWLYVFVESRGALPGAIAGARDPNRRGHRRELA